MTSNVNLRLDSIPTPQAVIPLTEVVDPLATIRAKVLETMRNAMPLTTLFKPELKIDLSLFLKDQLLFRRLTLSLSELVITQEISPSLVETHLEKSEIIQEIKGMFKEPAPYLQYLYKACVDVLKTRSAAAKVNSPLLARIFTLKNALIALQSPLAIQNSQKQNGIQMQSVDTIRNEGFKFIKAVLSIHLNALQTTDELSFRERLFQTVEQLLPFTRQITHSYLQENKKEIPEDPFTYRNPTGLNHHGLAVAGIMEICLSALGYQTQLRFRFDLEPRVTLASRHALIEVIDPNLGSFMIDPCYRQFHKDILLDERKIPCSALLILTADEVADYIEKNIIPEWKETYTLTKKSLPGIRELLFEQDKLLAYTMDEIDLGEHVNVRNQEEWVRNSFFKIWNINDYPYVTSNELFRAIFEGLSENKETHNKIKAMNIAPLTHYKSHLQIYAELEKLKSDPFQKEASSIETLRLLSLLRQKERKLFSDLIFREPSIEPSNIDVCLIAYYKSIANTVNPEGKPIKAVYGCSGADTLSIFMATNATELTFVDLTPLTMEELLKVRSLFTQKDNKPLLEQVEEMNKKDNFFDQRATMCATQSQYSVDSGHEMDNLALKIFLNLFTMGVDVRNLKMEQKNEAIQLDFSWHSHTDLAPKNRRITYIRADITEPELYPPTLKKTLSAGIDIFFMKGAFWAPLSYPQFIPTIGGSIQQGGWLLMTECTSFMQPVNPEPSLADAGHKFVVHESESILRFREILMPQFDPLLSVSLFSLHPKMDRPRRLPGTNAQYWNILTMRQKVE